eukprot:TRINITY_DN7041_c0_g1_i3.p1 TRINITY_DN7041_c0_g1~~TRINITY_DN7041_c0_g1_i3.p1  ORF type:complete len:554 (-),score=125.63 TRINITY_DN7041_c0_g1_i3:56-1717(-)
MRGQLRQPTIAREDNSVDRRYFPCQLLSCLPTGVRAVLEALLPATWLKIQDSTHLVLVGGTIALCIQIVQTLSNLVSGHCLKDACVKEIFSMVFILPCLWYIMNVIAQYDDKLQKKQQQALQEKDNLTRSYNELLTDMDTLLYKSVESSTGLAERSFESKRRDFQRFLERVKSRYSTLYNGTKGDSDLLLKEFKRFCINWLHVFEECSIDPIQCPKIVVKVEEIERCTEVAEVADLCLERLRHTEVRFISVQRDQDSLLIQKKKQEFKRLTNHDIRVSQVLQRLTLPAPASSSEPHRGFISKPAWIHCGGSHGCFCKSHSPQETYPREVGFGCGRIVILSWSHAKLLLGIITGFFLLVYNIIDFAHNFDRKERGVLILSSSNVSIAEVCLFVLLWRFEELDVIQQVEREVKQLAQQKHEVEEQREKMTAFWSKISQLQELWLYRTVPRLDLYKEVHSKLEDAPKEDLLGNIIGCNQKLEDLDHRLGALEGWQKDGAVSTDDKKVFGKAIGALCQEEELPAILLKLEDAMYGKLSKMKALTSPRAPSKSKSPRG